MAVANISFGGTLWVSWGKRFFSLLDDKLIMCLLFHFHLLCQYFIHLGKPLKATGGANLSDTLPPFQLILVGVHWRQLGQSLANLVQRVPGMSTVMHKFRRGTTWVARLASHLQSQTQCGAIMELLQYKPNPFMWIIYALCLYWSSISELHVFSNTHRHRKPFERYLVVVIWAPNGHQRSAIYCATTPLLHACSLLAFHSYTTTYRAQSDPCCPVAIYFACVPKEVCIINVTC